MFKYKFRLIALILLISLSVVIVNAITDHENDNIPDSIEKLVPAPVKKFLIENIFYKERLYASIERYKLIIENKNKEVKQESKVVDKLLNELYEIGLDNLKFFKVKDKQEIVSKNLEKFQLTTFQTDYLSIGTWPHTKASAYLELYEDQVILVSKDAIISHFNISSFEEKNFQSKIIKSNIKNIIVDDTFYVHGGRGIKDVLIDENKIFVTYSNRLKKDCYNISILVAEINLQYLNFEKYFEPPTCLMVDKGFNRWSDNSGGGRLVKFKDNKYLFSHGGFKTRVKAQDNETVFGKNIEIDNETKSWKIISKGHRNVQGLYYDLDKDFIISTEHGPMGGDEININNLNSSEINNYGWPISAYGEHYGGIELNKENYLEAPLYKSHSEYGFVEPTKYFVPSIGITEIKKIPLMFNRNYKNDFFIGSMGTNIKEGDLSLHQIRLNSDNNDIIYHDIIGIGERIRDLIYVENLNKFIMFLENSASIGILEN